MTRQYFNKTVALAVTSILLITTGCLQEEKTPADSASLPSTKGQHIIVDGPTSQIAGSCSAYLLKNQDSVGATQLVTTDTTVFLSDNGTGTFYSDGLCTNPVATATILAGSAMKAIYYKNATAPQSLILMAGSPSLSYDTHFLNITSSNGSAETLALGIQGSDSIGVSACSVFTVRIQNSANQAVNANALTTVALQDNGTGAFYANSACTTPVSSVAIASGSAFSSFYYKNSIAPQTIVLAANAAGIGTGTKFVNVSASGSGGQLSLAMDGPSSISAQTCGSFALKTLSDTFQVTPAATGVTVALSDNSTGSFYSDAGCTAVSPNVSLSAGDSIKIFYYKTNLAPQSMTFIASATGLSAATKSLAITTNTDIATKIGLNGPVNGTAGTCTSALTVSTRNIAGTETAVTTNTTINLTGATGGAFYSDAGCTSAISSVNIAAGYSSANFYLKTNTTGILNLNADDAGPLTAGTFSLSIASNSAPAPTKLALIGPSTVNAGTCSTTFQIRTVDAGGAMQAVASNTLVSLNSSSGGTFYSDVSCTSAITDLTIGTGSSSADFYFKSNSVGATTLTTTASGLLTTNQTLNISANSPSKLTFGGLSTLTTGTCSAYNLITRDSANNVSNVGSSVLVNLSGASPGSFYSDSSCASPITSASISVGTNSQTVYFRSTVGGSFTLSASDAGSTLSTGTMALTVLTSPVTKLTLSSIASTPVNTCIAVNLVARDAANYEAPVSSSTVVTMSGNGAGTFYSDSGCASAISTKTLAAGASSSVLYFKDSTAENLVLTASASGLSNGTQALAVNPGAPSKLALTGTASIAANTCAFYTVATQDSLGNNSSVGSDTVIGISATGAGQFYTDSSCSAPTSSALISAGTSSKIIYYKNATSQSVNFTAAAGGYTGASLAVNISTDPPTKLMISSPSTILAGSCQQLTTTTKNASNLDSPVGAATVITLSGAGAGGYYSDAACTTPISTLTLALGTSTGTLYYKNNSVQSVILSLSASGLTTATQSVQVNPGAPSLLSLAGSGAIGVNECASYTIRLSDSLGNDSPVTFNTALVLGGAGTGSFYDSSNCTNPISNTILAANNSIATVFYRNSAPQSLTLSVDDSGPLTAGTLAVNVSTAAPTKLVLSGAPSMTAGDCIPVTLTSKNDSNIASPVSGATMVTLAGTGGGSFYTSSSCSGGAVSTTTLAAGSSSNLLYFKDTQAESLPLSATAGGLAPASLALLVNAGNPSKLSLSGASVVNLGVCNVYIAAVKDINNNDAVSSTTRIITLAGAGAGAFYNDGSCTAPITNLQIPANQSAAVVYFKTATPASLTLSGTSTGLSAASLAISAQPLVPSKLALSGDSSFNVNACASFTVTSQDSNGYPSTVSSTTAVTLSAPTGTYYSDAGCSSSTGGVTIANGTSSVSFYYKTNVAGTVTTTATASGLTDANRAVTVNPGTPTQLSLTGPASVSAGLCSLLTLETRDANNNAAPVASTTSVNLTGAGMGGFYSDAACSSVILNSVFSTGDKTKYVYFKDSVQENVTLNASSTLGSSALPVSVQAQPPAKLVFSGSASFAAGSCQAFTISSKDGLNNTAPVGSTISIALTGGGSLGFFSNAGCSTSTTTASITSGNSSTTVYLKETVAGNLSLNAATAGLTSGSFAVTVNPAAPASLLLGGSSFVDAGICSVFTLEMKDTYGNSASPASSKSVVLSGVGSGAFYTDATCLSVTTSAIFSPSDSAKILYYKNNSSSTTTLSASASGLTASTLSITVSPQAASKLVMAGASNFQAATCSPYVITSKDSLNNIVNVASNTTVTLAGGGSLGFFSNAGCTTSTTTATISLGASTTTVYLKETVAASLLLSASASGLSTATFPVTVTPGPATQLALTGSNSISASLCSVYTLSLLDAYGNLANVTSLQTISLSGLGAGSFYSNNDCSSNAPAFNFSAGENSKVVYFKDNLAESVTLTTSGSGLTNGTLAVTVNAFVATKLALAVTSPFPANSCATVTVYSQDAQGNNSNVSSGKTVSLTTDGNGSFYSNSGCTSSTSSVSIANGTNSATVYYKSSVAESSTLSGFASGFTTGTVTAVVSPLTPTTISLNGPNALNAGTCGAYILEFKDSLANNSPAGATKPVNLTGGGAGGFYSDSGCLSPITSISFGPSQSQKSIYFKSSTNGTYNLAAADTGAPDLTDATFSVTVTGATGSSLPALSFFDSGRTVSEGQGEITIQVNLDSASTSTVSANYTVSGTAANPARHNLSNGSITIPAGQTSAQIKFLVYDNAVVDPTQTVVISLTSPVNAQLGTISTTTISIQDNDGGTLNLGLSQAARAGTSENVMSVDTTSCLIKSGALYCWGINNNGQIGDGTATARYAPVAVTGMSSGVTSVVSTNNSGGAISTCAIKNGALYCWGYNAYGQLGDGTTTNRYVPVAVTGMSSGVTQVSISYEGTVCAIKSAALYCWGRNNYYTVGNGSTSAQYTPYSIPTLMSGVTYVVTHRGRTCAIQNGNLLCWGSDNAGTGYAGAMGDGTTNTSSGNPITILTGGVTQVVMPEFSQNTCALKSGAVYCWGYNGYYTVPGKGSTSQVLSPMAAPAPLNSGVSYITGGNNANSYAATSFCALKAGALYCWGYNGYGQIGDGTTANKESVAVQNMSAGVTDVVMHFNTTCAIRLGAAYCWGNNGNGQIGDGTTTNNSSPVVVSTLSTGVTKLFASKSNDSSSAAFCAIKDGAPYCWGYNGYGQIGNLSTTQQPTPYMIRELSSLPATALSDSSNFSITSANCMIQSGALYCAGSNGSGQLGDGSTTDRSMMTPVFSSGVTLVTQNNNQSTCAIRSGALYCWGYGGQGQLGNGSTGYQYNPTPVTGLGSGVTSVVMANGYTCAIQSGALYCWGTNISGQLGNGGTSTSYVPVAVTGLTSGVTQVVVNGNTTCAIKSGAVYCWGANSNGMVGNNGTSGVNYPTPMALSTLSANVLQIAAGGSAFCANQAGSLYCWGYNGYGQIGDGTTTDRFSPTAASVLTSDVVKVVGQKYGFCALQSTGALWCWGNNSTGQIGDGTITNRLVPTNPIGMSSGVTAVYASGGSHTCSSKSGMLYCWGTNGNGQLGDGTTSDRSSPVAVAGMSAVTQVLVGDTFTCAVQDGTASCWGYNYSGRFGNFFAAQGSILSPLPVQYISPTPIPFGYILRPATYRPAGQIGAGTSHTCNLLNGKVFCWGSNAYGQLGDGTNTDHTVAAQVGTISDAVELAVGSYHNCLIRSDFSLWCWGKNSEGQLGLGTTTDQLSPVKVGTRPWRSVRAGGNSTCGDSAGLYCWGDNSYGQLGIGSTTSKTLPQPINVDAYDFAVGTKSACAVGMTVGGPAATYCWGDNSAGQIGDGTSGNIRNSATTVLTTSTFMMLSVGSDHACGLKTDGTAMCWGYNSSGQLGDGTLVSRKIPTAVLNLTNLWEIRAGGAHTCSMDTSGIEYCWGYNSTGQLGVGGTVSTSTPTQLSLNSVITLGTGLQHSCFIRSSGDTLCAGLNTSGQLGIGSLINRTIPDYVQNLTP